MKPRINSYFSGAGLFDIGLSDDCEIMQSFEIDKKCCEVQRENLGHEVVQVDISKKLAFEQSDANVNVFTYPCTKYSTIADIHGTRTGDDLFLHAFRHVVLRRPDVFVVENVPGIRKFPVVMEALQKLPDYYTQVFCPVKAETWLPQRRDRLIVIASRRKFNWRPPSSRKRVTLKQIVEKPDTDMVIPKCVINRMNGKYRDKPIISDPSKGDIAPTCVAHYAKDMGTRVVADRRFPLGVRPYTVREYARLQGVPDWFKFSVGKCAAYRMIGNGVPVPIGQWVGRELKRYFKSNSRKVAA